MDSDACSKLTSAKQHTRYKFAQELSSRPSFALLPSPDLLASEVFGRERDCGDRTETQKDARSVLKMAGSKDMRNVDLYSLFLRKTYNDVEFKNAVNTSFTTAFNAIGDRKFLSLGQLVFWYYTGHGLSPPGVPRLSAIPMELDVFNGERDRPTKGGELCLHNHGFCDLQSLLVPFVRALETNPHEVKSNKHLVIVLDSCYSGIPAGKLESLYTEDLPKPKSERHLWNTNGCSVTVQAACSAKETTFGGYFTPTFLRLQYKSERERLMGEWEQLSPASRSKFKMPHLPSPNVETTNEDLLKEIGQNPPAINLEEQVGFELWLFPNPAFFKYCFITLFMDGRQDVAELNKDRRPSMDMAEYVTYLRKKFPTMFPEVEVPDQI